MATIERTMDARHGYATLPDQEVADGLGGESLADRWRELGYRARPLIVGGYLLVAVKRVGGGWGYPERRLLDTPDTLVIYAASGMQEMFWINAEALAGENPETVQARVEAAFERATITITLDPQDVAAGMHCGTCNALDVEVISFERI